MRKTLLVLAVAASAMLIPGLLQTPAEAGISWSIGSVFSVGGFDFTLVLGRPWGYYGDGYYYRTHRPLHYHGYRCHSGCSYRAGYYFHHPDCSVVHHHFRRYSFNPWVYRGGGPWYYGSRPYYDRYRHDYWRYDRHRYDRYRYYRHRYDRHRYYRHHHDRDRGHRHRWHRDRSRHDHRRDGEYRRDDRHRRERYEPGRRRGSDTRSRGRR